MKAIINANTYDFADFHTDRFVLFGEKDSSRISACGDMKDFQRENIEEVIDAKGMLLMPGLLIGHAHLYGYYMRGMRIAPYAPETFTQNLRQLYWKMDAGLDREASYHSARAFGIEHIRNGVTTIVDHHASGTQIRGTLAELKRGFTDELGLRALYCFETSDRFPVEECIAENVAFAKGNRSEKCRGLFGIHASLSVSNETLEKIAAAQDDVPVHVHVGESLEDEVECLNDYGMRIAERLDSFGLLKPDSVLAHCVNINEAEAEIIRKRGCVVAINPTSNMNTGVGLPDYQMMKQFDLPVIIGNDSLGSNIVRCYNNMLYCMHLRTGSPWRIGYDDVRNCILTGYDYASRMLGVGLGRIEPGFEADMLLTPYVPATPMDDGNAFAHLIDGVFGMFRPRDVWVGGEEKLRNNVSVFDEQGIFAQSRGCAKQYWNRTGGIQIGY